MRALVVYESMYGNTRMVAEAIAEGLVETYEVAVVRIGDVRPDLLDGIDLLVVGGPTHAWSMSRPNTRRGAAQAAQKPDSRLRLEPGAEGTGLREWLTSLARLEPHSSPAAAVFDTRMPGPAILTGRASKPIARRLRGVGYRLIAAPESFRVSRSNELLPGEPARAQAWGTRLAAVVPAG